MKLYIKTEVPYEEKTSYEGDSGFDLKFVEDVTFSKGSYSNKVDFKIQCMMINEEGKQVSYMLMPRSSIVKTPLRMSNSIGLIDAGYRGNIMAFVDNVGKQTYNVSSGTSLFQIVAPNLVPFHVEFVNELPESDRGTGGFGSTD